MFTTLQKEAKTFASNNGRKTIGSVEINLARKILEFTDNHTIQKKKIRESGKKINSG